MTPRPQPSRRTHLTRSESQSQGKAEPAALIAFVPGRTLSPRLSLVGLAMGALLAVYAFMSVAHACGPMFRPSNARWAPGMLAVPPPKPTAESKAFAALREGRVVEALRLFEKAGHKGWTARLRHQLGLESRAKGQLDAALKHLRLAVAANGEHIGAVAELVRTAALAGRLDEARRVLRGLKANLAKEPMVVAAHARLLAAAGDVRGAVALLTALDRTGRLHREDRVWMGKLHLRLFKPGALDRQI